MANNLKGLDADQVIRSVYEETDNSLRVSIVDGQGGGSGVEVIINHTDDSIRLGDGTNFLTSSQLPGKNALDVSLLGVNTVNGSAKTIVSNKMITDSFDYVGATYPTASSEVYTYKFGGVSGTIVGVITVTYTDPTKNNILTVVKT